MHGEKLRFSTEIAVSVTGRDRFVIDHYVITTERSVWVSMTLSDFERRDAGAHFSCKSL